MIRFLLFSITLFSTSLLFAGDNPPLGARTQGLAGCGVALSGDLWGVQNNPASLGFIQKFQAGAFYESRFLVPGLGQSAVAAALPVKAGVFGLNMSSLSLQNLYMANKVGLGFAKTFGPKISAAVQLNWVYTRFGNNYGAASSAVADVGFISEPVKNLTFGIHIFNITRSKLGGDSDENIPTVMRVGGAYKFSEKLLVTLEAEKDIDFKPVIRGGIEYRPADVLYLRAGVASNPGLSAFGFGLMLQKMRLDVATTFHPQLGFSPSVGLQYML
ncbi:MAG: hypothetical protein MUC87_07160 [Bacteroidia bacterium]|jgi:hypothetical protein|nr:hypothetical protein [Bacteroidia bacterium]